MPQALLADEMGLGKSCQTILAADMIGARDILVVCPASVRVNWEREFERFSPMYRPCTVLMSGKDKLPAGGVVICSYDMLQSFNHLLKARQWDVLVLDEAHYLKERSAQRTRA
ncbi:MAG: SNF2-related protein, partial [Verrucomicrobiota bacterium]